MKAPGWKMLGFGTQFLDADQDGRPEIVVTNGHVFDLSRQNQIYEMPPQVFRNLGEGKFAEISAAGLGPFFKEKYLGRGLARVDWNQDGLDDFVVSHMRSPAGLLSNQSVAPGRFFCLRLVGTLSNRDAIGTRVTIRCGQQTWTQQLTAGDGFEFSNERKVLFGLGSAERINEVTVEWLSGERHLLQGFESNSEWLFVEGHGGSKAYRLKGK
jgi:hypothetical protein